MERHEERKNGKIKEKLIEMESRKTNKVDSSKIWREMGCQVVKHELYKSTCQPKTSFQLSQSRLCFISVSSVFFSSPLFVAQTLKYKALASCVKALNECLVK